jgi:hypothetical protein
MKTTNIEILWNPSFQHVETQGSKKHSMENTVFAIHLPGHVLSHIKFSFSSTELGRC